MLPGSAEVENVVCGEGGLLSGVNAEHLIVDMSTIDPLVSNRLAREVVSRAGGPDV
ncbi:MAG: hypothetical protein CM1200mP41_14110 [Gammaproteobacteria bacterium]|nr:MAG: hypothetical protein CM1200mP41_14110 [Gammaproteobacteria bacterium]